MNVYQAFISTPKDMIKLFKTLKATKTQIFFKLILPYNYSNIISSLKVNLSMSLVGIIMGEFLVSKQGIGYLIVYGSQVFNLNLVFTGIIILLVVSYLMYLIVLYIERALIRNN
jgi:NitT/TauT family transport system permease protein